MSSFEESVRQIAEALANKTLTDLCAEAQKEMNGTLWQAFRPSNPETGNQPRLGLIVCMTGQHELSRTSKLGPVGRIIVDDWTDYSVARLWINSFDLGGLAYVEQVQGGKRVALVLCASDPEKIELLEGGFGLSS
jgi:hypothetical protein